MCFEKKKNSHMFDLLKEQPTSNFSIDLEFLWRTFQETIKFVFDIVCLLHSMCQRVVNVFVLERESEKDVFCTQTNLSSDCCSKCEMHFVLSWLPTDLKSQFHCCLQWLTYGNFVFSLKMNCDEAFLLNAKESVSVANVAFVVLWDFRNFETEHQNFCSPVVWRWKTSFRDALDVV